MQERIKAGAKQEDFLIAEGAAASSLGNRSAAKKRKKPKKKPK
jgi:hypothetical protein